MLHRYARLRSYTRLRPKALKPKRGYFEDPAYRRWIHTMPCIVHDGRCGRWVEMHHVGRPRNDRRGLPLCAALHREGREAVHQIGRRVFEERFHISFEAVIQALNEEYEFRKARRIA